jgi:hypothetical protein
MHDSVDGDTFSQQAKLLMRHQVQTCTTLMLARLFFRRLSIYFDLPFQARGMPRWLVCVSFSLRFLASSVRLFITYALYLICASARRWTGKSVGLAGRSWKTWGLQRTHDVMRLDIMT